MIKKVLLPILFLILFSCSEKHLFQFSEMSLDEIIVTNKDKIIMIDFYSENWGSCLRLEVETLNTKEVVEFSNKHLIPIKINAWDNGSGYELFNSYNGVYIPLVLFLDPAGKEIDRFVGFKNKDEFLSILNNIINNKDTYMSLFDKYLLNDNDPDIIDKLSYKSEIMFNDSLSSVLYDKIINNPKLYEIDTFERAEFYFAKMSIKKDDNVNKMKLFIEKNKTSSRISEAYDNLVFFYKIKNDTINEVEALKEITNLNLDKASYLNRYAWRMTEINKELKDALIKINLALDITDKSNKSYPQLLDTKAEVFWMMELYDDAINIINEAIELDDEYQYYKDQKQKFLKSKRNTNTDSA